MAAAVRPNIGFAILLLMSNVYVAAQTAAPSANLSIFLPPNTPGDSVHVRYALYGPFGAYGSYSEPKLGTRLITIPLAFEQKAATAIKGLVWAAGCEIETFDMPLEGLDVQRTFSCRPQRTVRLSGKMRDTESIDLKQVEIRVHYLAGWACRFFSFLDCSVPQIPVGFATIAADGSFEIDLPDFGADPTASQPGSEFQLVLQEIKTWNLIAFLHAEQQSLRTSGRELKVLSEYPQPIVVVFERIH